MKRRGAALAASVTAAAGLLIAGGQPASAATNTLMLCVTAGSSSSGSLWIQPSGNRGGLGSALVMAGSCWSTYFDTAGIRTIEVYRNGKYYYSTAWNSDQGAKAIYL